MPAWPVGHDAQLCLSVETAQPDPLLQDVAVCELLSCHLALGHVPQTMLLSASQAVVCRCPLPHVSQSLHEAFPSSFWKSVPAVHPGHDPKPAWPSGHALQLFLSDATAHPEPALHEVWVFWF